jgi:hypothetical protein
MSPPKRDPRLEEMIDAGVMGDSTSPWDIDPKYPPKGTLQDRFNAGDKQILLWAIKFSAREGKPVPEWAAKALADVLYKAATGKFASWDEAFGRIFGRKKRATMLAKARDMISIYDRVVDEKRKGNPIGNPLFEQIAEELRISHNTVARYYARVRDYVKARRK